MKTKQDSTLSIRHSAFSASRVALLTALTLFTTAPRAPAQSGWGNALFFDGVNDSVRASGITLTNASMTIEVWAQRASFSTWNPLVCQGWGALSNGLYFSFCGNGMMFGYYGGELFASGSATDTNWHHWAATHNLATGERCIYRDGQVVATDTNWWIFTGSGDLWIGEMPWSAPDFFGGQMDEVRIWNVARSAGEIRQHLYHRLTGQEPNLIGYWKFDGGAGTIAHDSTTNGHDGALNGPQWTLSTIPRWGNALSFDGENDYVQAGNVPLTNSSCTLEAWARRDSSNTVDIILGQGTWSANQGLHFGFDQAMQNKFVFGFYNNELFTTNSYTDTNWHHWAGTYDVASRIGCIYRDGVLVSSGMASENYQGSGPLLIGTQPWGTGAAAFHGCIDDVRIWNKARSQAEIAADMVHPLTGSESNLAAYWTFDEGFGSTTAYDRTTNQFDGILTNGTVRVASTVSAPNLAVNPGFEDGTTGWFGFGWATLTATNAISHSGSYSGLVSDRTNTWSAPAQSLLGILQPGIKYYISAWVRLANSSSGPVALTFQKTDGEGTTYQNVASGTATSNQWTQLSGSYALNVTGVLTGLTLYLEGPNPGTNFYVDDFVIAPDLAGTPLALASTLPPTGLLNDTATLNGTVVPNGLPTTAWFEWGTGWVFDHATDAVAVGNGWETLSVSNALTGLTPGLIYHYRLVASNSVGLVRATNQTFWLPAIVLNSPDPLTNECHAAFVDPGARVSGYPVPIAGGGYHTLALQADGTVVGWGYNNYGQATGVPSTNSPFTSTGMVMLAEGPLSNVVAIEAGLHFSLALRTDGTVVSWGRNDYGQTNIPAIATNVVAIAAGHWHSLALRADGKVVGWGRNNNGQATGVINGGPGLVTLGGNILSNVVAISGGYYFSLALKADGTVVGWGSSDSGQANGTTAGSNVVAIAAGGAHGLALKANGTVVSWGYNWYGQATTPVGLTNAVAIAAGEHHSLALRANGTVVGWGYSANGQVNGALAGSNVVVIAAGHWHSLALWADNTIVGFGSGTTDTGSDPNFGQATRPGGLKTLPYHRSLNTMPYTVSGTVNTNAPDIYPLTYRTTNSLGAVATATRTVVVADTLRPVLTLLGENPLMLELGAPFTDPGATASDLCAGDLTPSIVLTNTVNANLAGAYTNTFTVIDASGNVAATNRLVLVVTRPVLTGLEQPGGGAFRFTFASTPGACFNVITTTNLSLPPSQWTVLGPATENPPGQFQFTDLGATNHPACFYQLRWP